MAISVSGWGPTADSDTMSKDRKWVFLSCVNKDNNAHNVKFFPSEIKDTEGKLIGVAIF